MSVADPDPPDPFYFYGFNITSNFTTVMLFIQIYLNFKNIFSRTVDGTNSYFFYSRWYRVPVQAILFKA